MMNGRVRDRILTTAAEIFHCPEQAVAQASALEDLPGWESIAHLNFILALEQEFGCTFTDLEVERLTSVPAIIDVIDGKQRG